MWGKMKKLLGELSKHDLDMTWIHCDPIGRKSHICSWGQDTLMHWDSAIVWNKLKLMVGTSLRGRMIMVFFCDLYDYLCSNMIFDLMSYMNKIQFPLIHDDYLILLRWYEYDGRSIDRGHWPKIFLPIRAPMVWNWDRGILGLRELWRIGYHPYLLPIGLE